MICPFCKNEKLNQSTCPNCGLEEKEAILKAAELYRTEGKIDLAMEYYGRYLTLEPNNFEVTCKRASYLATSAMESRDPEHFRRAESQLAQILETHWDWQAGHQVRIELYFCFGKLDALLKDYEMRGESDQTRKAICDQMVKIIRLVLRFKDEKTEVSPDLTKEGDLARLVKCFWPLLLGVFLAWIILAINPFPSQQEVNPKGPILLDGLLGLILLGLAFLGMWRFQKLNPRKKTKTPLQKPLSLDGIDNP